MRYLVGSQSLAKMFHFGNDSNVVLVVVCCVLAAEQQNLEQ